MASKDFQRQLGGYGLTTASILYRRPDHPWLLQTYVWQDYDLCSEFPATAGLPEVLAELAGGRAAFGDGGAFQADQAGRAEGDRRRIPAALISLLRGIIGT